MSELLTYTILGMSCGHCTDAIERELRLVAGVQEVRADLETKSVRVVGDRLDDSALRAAIAEAGYEAR